MTAAAILLLLLPPLLLLTLPCGLAAQVSYPVTVEFDSVFPRSNATYAPLEILPLVFAIQNPQALGSPIVALRWQIQGARGEVAGNELGPVVNVSSSTAIHSANSANGTSVYFAVDYTTALNNTEGEFFILWQFYQPGCPLSFTSSPTLADYYDEVNTTFTIQKGAQPFSLENAPGVCPTEGRVFNVTGLTTNSCAVVATLFPPMNPCAVQVGSAIASSIEATVTADFNAATAAAAASAASATAKKSLAGRLESSRMGLWSGMALWSSLGFLLFWAT